MELPERWCRYKSKTFVFNYVKEKIALGTLKGREEEPAFSSRRSFLLPLQLTSDAQPPPGGVMGDSQVIGFSLFPPTDFLHLFFQSIFGLQRKNTHRRFIEWLQNLAQKWDRWELSSHTLRVFFTLDTSHLDPLHYTRRWGNATLPSDSKLFADWALLVGK